MKVSSAVEKIIEERGKEILKSSDIVQAMVMDYVTGSENEKKLFRVSCKNGILDYAYEILQLSDMEQQRILAVKAKSWLKQEAFLSEENAVYAINIILEALCVGFQLMGDEIRNEKIELEKRNTGELSREEDLWHTLCKSGKKKCLGKNQARNLFPNIPDEIIIPNGYSIIGKCAFEYLRFRGKTKRIIISETVEEIQDYAFDNLKVSDYIEIPKSVTKIGDYFPFRLGKFAYIKCEPESYAYEYCRKNYIKNSVDNMP